MRGLVRWKLRRLLENLELLLSLMAKLIIWVVSVCTDGPYRLFNRLMSSILISFKVVRFLFRITDELTVFLELTFLTLTMLAVMGLCLLLAKSVLVFYSRGVLDTL